MPQPTKDLRKEASRHKLLGFGIKPHQLEGFILLVTFSHKCRFDLFQINILMTVQDRLKFAAYDKIKLQKHSTGQDGPQASHFYMKSGKVRPIQILRPFTSA